MSGCRCINIKEPLPAALLLLPRKFFALEQMEEWFSEVGCWFFNGWGKVFGRIWTNCFSGFRMFGFSMDGIGS